MVLTYWKQDKWPTTGIFCALQLYWRCLLERWKRTFWKKLHLIFFSEIKKFVFFQRKFASFTDFKTVHVSLAPYVFEKSFYFTSIIWQICYNPEENFKKVHFVKINTLIKIFWNLAKIFWTIGKVFQHCCQNCNLHVQRNILKKKNHLLT